MKGNCCSKNYINGGGWDGSSGGCGKCAMATMVIEDVLDQGNGVEECVVAVMVAVVVLEAVLSV